MAEDFPRYRQEDSDDDVPAERSADRAAPPPAAAAEHHVPAQQEGTIFSRDLAPSLSRPLFDFIRKQEQPESKLEMPGSSSPELLPSVSVPGEPEVRTYQPPVEAEIAQAIHEAAADDDDDEEEADDAHTSASKTTQPTQPVAQPQEARQRPLSEQFEEIMRTEMGEDFTRLTSGNRLGEPEPEPQAAEQPVAYEPVMAAAQRRQPEWPTPIIPEVTAAEPAEEPKPAAGGTPPRIPPPPPTESAAFYYNEEEPEETATYAMAGGTPPPPPRYAGASSSAFSAPGAYNIYPSASAAPAMETAGTPLSSRQEKKENHNGRWFVAGFITGWVIKQHLANKKLARVQEASRKTTEAQNEKINTLGYDQYHLQQKLKRNEGQLQEARTQTAQAVEAARTSPPPASHFEQTSALNQPAQQFEQAAAVLAASHNSEQQPAPLGTAQAPASPVERQPASTLETPLQYAAAAEMPFAAAPGRSATGETPASKPFVAETVPQSAVSEHVPQSAHEAAKELVSKAYELHSGQHVEHAAGGGHNIIVDKHGHEVQNAMEYGDEFQFQRRQEQVRAGASASDNRGAPAGQSSDNQTYRIVTGLGSGQMDASHGLPLGPPTPAARQRLLPSKKENPLVATIVSPWLWASVIVLLAAFFVAAFI